MTDGSAIMSDAALVLMGVAGSGKSTVGEHCARQLGWPFIEGDAFHPPANRQKMAAGRALTDGDRQAWLQALCHELQQHDAPLVLSCSALKRHYRDLLRAARPGVRFVHLSLPEAQARERVQARSGHLFPVSLVASQYAALEPPTHEADVLELDAREPVAALMGQIGAWLSGGQSS